MVAFQPIAVAVVDKSSAYAMTPYVVPVTGTFEEILPTETPTDRPRAQLVDQLWERVR